MPRDVVIDAVTALAEAFGRTATDVTVAAYEIGLADLSDEQVNRATAAALQRCKFMPVPAELRELAGASGATFDGMAERAFLVLQEAVRRLGPDYSVNFADGAINAAVRIHGGWIRVCELPREEFDKWFRKDFIATYVRVCRDGASEDLRRYHGGRLERDNAQYDGRSFPSGLLYHLGDFGSGVVSVGSEYKPALPSPVVEQRKSLPAPESPLKADDLTDREPMPRLDSIYAQRQREERESYLRSRREFDDKVKLLMEQEQCDGLTAARMAAGLPLESPGA